MELKYRTAAVIKKDNQILLIENELPFKIEHKWSFPINPYYLDSETKILTLLESVIKLVEKNLGVETSQDQWTRLKPVYSEDRMFKYKIFPFMTSQSDYELQLNSDRYRNHIWVDGTVLPENLRPYQEKIFTSLDLYKNSN